MKKLWMILVKVSFVIYLLVLFYLIFLWHRGYWQNMSMIDYAIMQMNLIPFKTIGGYISALFDGSMNLSIPLTNLLGNLLMFLPMGIYLPLLFPKIDSGKKYYAVIVIILFGIEVVQFLTQRGAFDIDDFILNLLGTVAGFFIWKSKNVQKLKSLFEH